MPSETLRPSETAALPDAAFRDAASFLHASPLPKPESRLLLQYATGQTAAQLITRDREPLPAAVQAKLSDWLQRRLAGEPVAYLVGEREFYGRRFAVTPDTLIPRPETEHLVETALAHLPPQGRVWDLGTGSGIVALTLALERPDAAVWASDLSAAALAVAKQNAHTLGAAVHFGCGSWFEAFDGLPPMDLLVSNPPYIEADDEHLQQGDLRFEPQQALTDYSDGLSCIRHLAAHGAGRLNPGGWLMVEHGYRQGKAVRALFQTAGWQQVETVRDLAGWDRITLGRKAA